MMLLLSSLFLLFLPSLISAYCFSAVARTKQYDLVLHLCKQMESNGIAQHNLYTLSIVINCFCRLRKLGFAFSVVGKMLKLGYEPSTVTFSTLINGLCLQGRVSQAMELVHRMVEMKFIPNLITLNTLVNGLCLQGEVSEAVALIDRMTNSGCQADQFTYGPVLNRMCKSGDTALALDLFRKMEDRKVKPHLVTFNTIIDSLRKMSLRGVVADTVTFNIMIRGLCEKGSLSEAGLLVEEDGIAPISGTYNTLIRAHLRDGDLTTSAELIQEMKRCGFSADGYGYVIGGEIGQKLSRHAFLVVFGSYLLARDKKYWLVHWLTSLVKIHARYHMIPLMCVEFVTVMLLYVMYHFMFRHNDSISQLVLFVVVVCDQFRCSLLLLSHYKNLV